MSARPERPEHAPPATTLAVLRRRADLLNRTRAFFAARGVLEVEAPLLATGLVVDAHIDPITCTVDADGRESRYLLPSPEAPMKRLLAAGSGPIYALAKAFRRGEQGRLHRPEFTMLEWYRPGFTYHGLMDEVGELMRDLIGIDSWVTRTYGEVFVDRLGVDPHTADAGSLAAVAAAHGVTLAGGSPERDDWLNVLFATCIEPGLDPRVPTFVHDFPATQAALATVRSGDPPVAERFELLFGGLELCNGYQELLDADEHRRRFDTANDQRERMGRPRIAADERLIGAVEQGLPACSGVAVGFDRVVMLACGAASLDDVLPLS